MSLKKWWSLSLKSDGGGCKQGRSGEESKGSVWGALSVEVSYMKIVNGLLM